MLVLMPALPALLVPALVLVVLLVAVLLVLLLVPVLLVLLLVPVQLVPVVTCILRNLWCSSNSTRSFFVSADELSISKRSHSSSSVCIVEEGETVVEGIDCFGCC
jgi:hypothetical protein